MSFLLSRFLRHQPEVIRRIPSRLIGQTQIRSKPSARAGGVLVANRGEINTAAPAAAAAPILAFPISELLPQTGRRPIKSLLRRRQAWSAATLGLTAARLAVHRLARKGEGRLLLAMRRPAELVEPPEAELVQQRTAAAAEIPIHAPPRVAAGVAVPLVRLALAGREERQQAARLLAGLEGEDQTAGPAASAQIQLPEQPGPTEVMAQAAPEGEQAERPAIPEPLGRSAAGVVEAAAYRPGPTAAWTPPLTEHTAAAVAVAVGATEPARAAVEAAAAPMAGVVQAAVRG